jgi:predicted esterase
MVEMKPLLAIAILWLGLAPSAGAGEFAMDTVIPKVATLASPEQQYALYLPPGYDPARRWPLLIILDPGGRAEKSIALAVAGARRNGWIVMSSWQSRSDTLQSVTILALQALLDESDKRVSADRNRLYLAGMSGTAKILWVVVEPLRGNLAGLIGCAGGRTPDAGKLGKAVPAFFGCSGYQDFNHREMMDLDEDLARVASPHHLQEFEGGHGWAKPDGFDQAIDWLQLQAMREGRIARDAAWIKSQFELARSRAAAQTQTFPAWMAWRQVRADFEGLIELGDVPAKLQTLEADPALQAARKQESGLREDEKRYQLVVDAWVARMHSRQPDGSPQDPPPKPQSLAGLKVRSLEKLAADPDALVAQSAQRRLELAYVAAAYYVPSAAEADGRPAVAKAARAVAEAIFPERAESKD